MTKLIAYHGKPKIKAFYKSRMDKHIKMDELIQGTYFDDGKGCFVGCTLHNGTHKSFETELGIPEEIAQISDAIFEGLSLEESKKFSSEFHNQIKVGADLSMIWPKFTLALLSDKDHGVLRFVKDEKFKQQHEAIDDVVKLYKEWIETGVKPQQSKWDAAWAAARDAAWAAAWAAGDAAWAAGDAAWAARDAAWAAGDAAWAARAAAGDAFWLWAKDKLFELLMDAK